MNPRNHERAQSYEFEGAMVTVADLCKRLSYGKQFIRDALNEGCKSRVEMAAKFERGIAKQRKAVKAANSGFRKTAMAGIRDGLARKTA